jgi:hypothetical protein
MHGSTINHTLSNMICWGGVHVEILLRRATDDDGSYAYALESGLVLSVPSPLREESYTCAPCGMRFADSICRPNFAIHINNFMGARRRTRRGVRASTSALTYISSWWALVTL